MKSLLAVALGLMASGCTLQPLDVSPADLDALKSVHDAVCPDDTPLEVFVGNDNSLSAADSVFLESRLPAIEAELTKVAVCGGKAKVIDFAGSSGASYVLFDGELKPQGATLNSRLRKVPDLVDNTVAGIRQKHTKGSAEVSRDGASLVGAFSSAKDYFTGTADSSGLRMAVFLSDGWTEPSTAADVPSLPTDVKVRIYGIGRFDKANKTPSQSQIDAAKGRIDALCKATGANCLPSMTEYTS